MATEHEMQDSALSGMAKTALALDPKVNLNEVSIDTVDGVVRLQGVVDNYEIKKTRGRNHKTITRSDRSR